MKKLSEKQIANLQDAKARGIEKVFLTSRIYFGTRYVCLFSVNQLLLDGFLPSYWYRDLGMTETQALNKGAERLLNW